MSYEPQAKQRRGRRWAVGAATLALAATGFSALSTTTASASGNNRPTAPCRESTQPPDTYRPAGDNLRAPHCGTWRLVPEWNPFRPEWGPEGPKMLAELLWEHTTTIGVNKYNIYRDGEYYDTVKKHGSFGSYYDDEPKNDGHVYQIVAVADAGTRDSYSPRSAPLIKRR